MLTMSLKRHNDHFRGFDGLNTDVNRIIFDALTVHVTVSLRLSTAWGCGFDFPYTAHTWKAEDVTCSDPDALVHVKHAVREAVKRENKMIFKCWCVLFCASFVGPHTMMLQRLQQDIGAALKM